MVEALTGIKPRIRRKKNGQIMIECYEGHLDGFARFAELAEAIVRRRRGGEPRPGGSHGSEETRAEYTRRWLLRAARLGEL